MRSLLTFLHVLLEPRLPLGYELGQLRLLVRGKNLVSLGGDARVLHFKLRVNLRSLSRDCLGLGPNSAGRSRHETPVRYR